MVYQLFLHVWCKIEHTMTVERTTINDAEAILINAEKMKSDSEKILETNHGYKL